jgi:hypothetical protein
LKDFNKEISNKEMLGLFGIGQIKVGTIQGNGAWVYYRTLEIKELK